MKYIVLLLLIIITSCTSESNIIEIENTPENIYFPPINSDIWETISAEELNWNTTNINQLYNYLETTNTKGFITLYNGKIVIEKYFNNHSASKAWYWASAGKTITSTLVGIAEEQNYININDKVSKHIGTGWTKTLLEKENLITCKHLLTMTSGLDDSLGDSVEPTNLIYKTDAGSRWAYHNVYKKLQDVIASATNTTFENYFNNQLKNKIGMTGTWVSTGNFNLYLSNTRSMARFGLLAMNNGVWDSNEIVNTTYFNNSTNTSQTINKAYGYLWWLNGKESFYLPQSQQVYSGKLIPNAPDEMYAALGKNDQKIYVVPSKKLVIIRMGENANSSNLALSSFDNELWKKINDILN
ncbi:CubicO group peptidase, beta-lactamase class C family [Lutibacter oricola]|uniref:CubicO group peptidase, beta-lactamase class C family n=1 Tax=Lutibacter oricola TaxID=762486 RepID=A0A1H3AKE3_9FLAO|nr:serine hydrolase [Lutibacter oricola]SDX30146.1 CubicO group peptidase, beta-lactamase class C family [Lutibacter oricola]